MRGEKAVVAPVRVIPNAISTSKAVIASPHQYSHFGGSGSARKKMTRKSGPTTPHMKICSWILRYRLSVDTDQNVLVGRTLLARSTRA
jgi:hypothetical protein